MKRVHGSGWWHGVYLNQNAQDSEAVGFVHSHGNVGVLVRVEVHNVHLLTTKRPASKHQQFQQFLFGVLLVLIFSPFETPF